MVVEPLNKNKIRIRLSNTESVGTNIYKYTSLDKGLTEVSLWNVYKEGIFLGK